MVKRNDSGSSARFFYCAKASKSERNIGCENLPLKTAGECTDRQDGTAGLNSPRAGAGRTNGSRNTHPTVKPIALMRYLCRLITPPNGVILDPFAGSGSTGVAATLEGFNSVLIEIETVSADIARARNAPTTPSVRWT
jgi:site-specific DNA-methyltransferase (adenine-specific)